MASLKAELSEFFGRALIVVRGADATLDAAERAMSERDFSLALRYAKELLLDVPRSPVALLLAADAAEGSMLDELASTYLAELAAVVPWRPEIWLRLGLARRRAGAPDVSIRDAFVRAASDGSAGATAIQAACELAEMDLASGDPRRALAWLDRSRGSGDVRAQELRAVALSELGDLEAAAEESASLDAPGPLEGRRSLLFGKLAAHAGGDAARYLLRAYVLEVPGAANALATYIAHGGERALTSLEPIVKEHGDLDAPIFRAAFAEARGDRAGSIEALGVAADAGDAEAAKALLVLALEARDPVALRRGHEAVRRLGVPLAGAHLSLADASDALAKGDVRACLDALDDVGDGAWASELRAKAVALLAPRDGLLALDGLLDEIRRAARRLDDSHALLATEALAIEAERPLRVAVMGEFNAGKSTFVNALLGADIAPTGVLPTTATLHHVVFSPDPFGRITSRGTAERVVSPERVRTAIAEVQAEGAVVTRVTVGLPLERLRHIELIDTPGFNAPDVAHAEEARRALEEVHLGLWLLDAGQPWKDTERRVLAEVHAAGVPIQLLVNKIDRVPEAERAAVMAYVTSSQNETGVTSLEPVIAFSSREALRGRLGDAEALAKSGWPAVEAMVDAAVVARAASLKDRAIRRRARGLLASLLARANELATTELAASRIEANERASMFRASDVVLRDRAPLVRAVLRALDEPRRALLDDLAPLRAHDSVPDAATRAYAADRAVQRLAAPLAEALLSQLGELPEAARSVSLHAVVESFHGFVSGLESPASVVSVSAERLVDAAAPAVAAALRAESSRWSPQTRVAAPLVSRLAALDVALSA